jgi:microcompartment protein CcmK/EutM
MLVARVLGNLVSSHKHEALEGHRMLLVQPCDLDGTPRGSTTMALDVVDAGVGDWVLLLDEGSSASQVLGRPRGPVRTLVVGIVDAVHTSDAAMEPGPARQSPQRQGVDRI